ncbi:MAG: SGNH/GDSL hydrolase family protein [Candidatus Omnitrophica bacterium]|nr:SGNH/GDSL hydrolase family protein [Candidatus Omnitrophota bacterium]MCK5259830.1 SGNH/GDSL hydrolase family protein [Candidatus Omnitrophota bacterium]
MKKSLFWLLLIAILLCSIELLSWFAIRYLKNAEQRTYAPLVDYSISEEHRQTVIKLVNDEFEYSRFDPDLGRTIKANGKKGLYQANSQKIRSDREYLKKSDAGVLRIAAFGDSFTHGDEVANPETWAAQMEASYAQLEVLNFGVPGYGLDQAYLRYLKEGVHFSPDIVLIGLTLPMLARSVSVYNPFRISGTSDQLAKPRFIIEGGKLKLISNPFQTLKDYERLLSGEHDFEKTKKYDLYYRRLYLRSFWDIFASVRVFKMFRQKAVEASIVSRKYVLGGLNSDTEAFKVTTRICKRFYQDVLDRGAVPIVVILPDGINILSRLKYKKEQMKPLILYLEANDLNHIHLMDTFSDIEKDKLKEYFAPKKHYSAKGNKLCAEKILEYLMIKGYINGDSAAGALP